MDSAISDHLVLRFQDFSQEDRRMNDFDLLFLSPREKKRRADEAERIRKQMEEDAPVDNRRFRRMQTMTLDELVKITNTKAFLASDWQIQVSPLLCWCSRLALLNEYVRLSLRTQSGLLADPGCVFYFQNGKFAIRFKKGAV